MIGRTTLGRDEMATWEFAQLSLPNLVKALGHVDAVLAPYYLFAHLWTSVDDGAVWLRLPSAIAAAAAVAVAARIADRAWGPWAGAVTGTALALHPTVVAEAVQARPYAAALLCCTLGTALVLADGPLRRHRYVVVMAVGIALHLFAIAVVVAHLVIVRRRSFLLPVAVLAVLALPLALAAHAQRIQVIYIPVPTVSSALDVLRQMAAPGDLQWLVLAAVLVLAATALRGPTGPALGALGSCAALVLVPLVLLYVASHLLAPVLNPRYLITAPLGVALAVGAVAGLVRLPGAWPAWSRTLLPGVLAVAILVAVAPAVRALHAPRFAGADFTTLARMLAHRADPGDGLQVVIRRSQGGMPAGVAYYTGDDAFLADVLRGLPESEPLVYERRITGPGASVAEPGLKRTTWLVAVGATQPGTAAVARLRASGCRILAHHPLPELTLYKARCPVS
ncbi:hypothetical protein EFK50_08360 [Nocardioides marmoriginsengisoli]|uniref:Glycosyltransferase RgtA/B/C/D-like domain-containing protein n=1 Tax=Nocardioides marmoriginsengisoli TaxID=661483 RepID=A0A3N0CJW5_9ACTN|nr:hypothetical protein [Nocardioides marmoriginsengisoli]RNL63735.1 hypothetical protein EFK50_08360 [Nocardioides marmoriginsengisoli]